MKRRSKAVRKPVKARRSKAFKRKGRGARKALARRSSAVQQLADWLERLGISEYAERFAENKIDVSVLRHLTDQDLKDIGVALGHRRKILAAIAEFAAATATEPKFFEPEPKPQEIAERRQVTVMFSDLVGSTALSARMDPE